MSSPDFMNGGAIPRKHTCEGEDTAPGLRWSDAPRETRSFVLIVDDPDAPDPDAPKMTYVHWVLYDIPAHESGLPAGGPTPAGARDGVNDWKKTGYGGPCPPIGRHRYFFKLYALDATLGDLQRPTKDHVLSAMQSHVLAEASLMGTYQKGDR